MRHLTLLGAGLLALSWLAACGGGDTPAPQDPAPTPTPPPAGVVGNFSLEDVNDTSPTFQAMVSPRDYTTTHVSAWYFGHAT